MKKLLLILCTIACISASAQIPTANLILYLPFSGSANDISGNNLNGTVYSASLTTDRYNNVNSAYSFNGTSSYIEVLDNNLLDLTDSATISLWFEMSSYTPGSKRLIDKGVANTNNGYIISVDSVNGYSFIGGSIGTLPGEGAPQKKLNLNQWYNAVIVFKNNTVWMYMNGQLDTSYVGTSPMIATSSNLRIGTASPAGAYFHGKIDDIRIYSSALNSNNVLALYNEGICKQTITVTDTLIISNPIITGFNPLIYSTEIKMYPNPTKSDLMIDFGDYSKWNGYTIKIMNSINQTVYQKAISTQLESVSFSSWTGNGIYFVHIIDKNGATIDIRKIVLQ